MVIREYEGKTERDAIKKASEDLGVDVNQMKVEVLGGKSRFFSFGGSTRIRVYLEETSDDLGARAEQFLQGLFSTIDVDIETRTAEEEDKIYLEIISDRAGMIIGKRGRTLEALQLLVNIVMNKGEDQWKKIILDIENYRDKREATLQDLARKVAKKVKSSGKAQFLEPMNPFERRVIHMALQDDMHVETKSEGSGNLKRVKVFLKKRKSSKPAGRSRSGSRS
jgi:spoIIIJ-associated protein